MRYRCTLDPSHTASLEEAVFAGLSPSGGLYLPVEIPHLSSKTLNDLRPLPLPEIASLVLRPFLSGAVEDKIFERICEQVFTFPAPLVQVSDSIFALELFHGPTCSFKDFGARFMAGLVSEFHARRSSQELFILVATSGDTGSAVAEAYLGRPGVKVILLYPKGGVSPLQELQMTTLGGNVTALEVRGAFDDCQRLVKSAFQDKELRSQRALSSANSINIARLLPQMVYYISSWAAIPPTNRPIVYSVPSGNFGNLSAGVIAKKMGLPLERFVAATNINDIVPEYLRTGVYCARKSLSTLSNAMDVGNPNNFPRLMQLFEADFEAFRRNLSGERVTDEETLATISELSVKYDYLCDPHGAIGYRALLRQREPNHLGVFLHTAHPAKFMEPVERAAQKRPKLPASLIGLEKRTKSSIELRADYEELRQFLFAAA